MNTETCQVNTSDQKRYFEALCHNKTTDHFITLADFSTGRPRHIHLPDHEELIAYLNYNGLDTNIYCAVGLRDRDQGEYRRCHDSKKDGIDGRYDVKAMFGFVVDADPASDKAHKKGNLPPSKDQCSTLIDSIPIKPTMIVDSGGGYQAYWLGHESFATDTSESNDHFDDLSSRFHHTILKDHYGGYVMDNVSDLNRVLRLPGTCNDKPERDRKLPCKIIYADGPRYTLEQIEAFCLPWSELQVEPRTVSSDYIVTGELPKLLVKFREDEDLAGILTRYVSLRRDADEDFCCTWDGERQDLPSQSEYDLSLATQIVNGGFPNDIFDAAIGPEWWRALSHADRQKVFIAAAVDANREHLGISADLTKCRSRSDYVERYVIGPAADKTGYDFEAAGPMVVGTMDVDAQPEQQIEVDPLDFPQSGAFHYEGHTFNFRWLPSVDLITEALSSAKIDDVSVLSTHKHIFEWIACLNSTDQNYIETWVSKKDPFKINMNIYREELQNAIEKHVAQQQTSKPAAIATDKEIIFISEVPLRDDRVKLVCKYMIDKNFPRRRFRTGDFAVRILPNIGPSPIIQRLSYKGCIVCLNEIDSCVTIYDKPDAPEKLKECAPSKDFASLVETTPLPYPELRGICKLPPLRRNGTHYTEPGFDDDSGLWHADTGLDLNIPEVPTCDDAIDSAKWLNDYLFFEFNHPNGDTFSRANLFAATISPVIRSFFDGCVPMAIVSANDRRCGKSTLTTMCNIIAVGGKKGPKMKVPDNETEFEKRFSAELQKNLPVLVLDNLTRAWESDSLSIALTEKIFITRLLGGNKMEDSIHIPVNSCLMLTANQADVRGDLSYRSYRIFIDKNWTGQRKWENPNFQSWILKKRSVIVSHLYTMIIGYLKDEGFQAEYEPPLFASFNPWAKLVGGILAFSGVEGFLDRNDDHSSGLDEDQQRRLNLLKLWYEKYPDKPMTMADVYFDFKKTSGWIESLPDRFTDILAEKSPQGFKTSVSTELKSTLGRILPPDNLKMECDDSGKVKTFTVTRI